MPEPPAVPVRAGKADAVVGQENGREDNWEQAGADKAGKWFVDLEV